MRLAGVAAGTVVSIGSAPLASAVIERVVDGRRPQRLGSHPVDAPSRPHPAGSRPKGCGTRRAGRGFLEGGDLGTGRTTRAACQGWICFEDEAGFTRRPPAGRTRGRRGTTPVVKVNGRRSGRVSAAGLIAVRPDPRTRLCHRLQLRTGHQGERRSLSEHDCIELIDGIHHLVRAPIVLVRDRLNTHVSHAMRNLIDTRDWITVFILPAYAPES
jgi:putative transposase